VPTKYKHGATMSVYLSRGSVNGLEATGFNDASGAAGHVSLNPSYNNKTEVVLDNSPSSTDGAYNNKVLEIVSGLGQTQARLIKNYDGGQKIATLDSELDFLPTSGECVIHSHSGKLVDPIFDSFVLQSGDQFPCEECVVRVLTGQAAEVTRRIVAYDDASGKATIDEPWVAAGAPAAGDLYVIYGESGTVAGSSNSNTVELEDGVASSSDDRYNGLLIWIHAGKGQDQVRKIADYDGGANVATLENDWAIQPDDTSLYTIFGGHAGTYAPAASGVTVVTSSSGGQPAVVAAHYARKAVSVRTTELRYHSTIFNGTLTHTFSPSGEHCMVRLIEGGAGWSGDVAVHRHDMPSAPPMLRPDEEVLPSQQMVLGRNLVTVQTQQGSFQTLRLDKNGNLPVAVVGSDSNGSIGAADLVTASELRKHRREGRCMFVKAEGTIETSGVVNAIGVYSSGAEKMGLYHVDYTIGPRRVEVLTGGYLRVSLVQFAEWDNNGKDLNGFNAQSNNAALPDGIKVKENFT
jgi:hypothetical protein